MPQETIVVKLTDQDEANSLVAALKSQSGSISEFEIEDTRDGLFLTLSGDDLGQTAGLLRDADLQFSHDDGDGPQFDEADEFTVWDPDSRFAPLAATFVPTLLNAGVILASTTTTTTGEEGVQKATVACETPEVTLNNKSGTGQGSEGEWTVIDDYPHQETIDQAVDEAYEDAIAQAEAAKAGVTLPTCTPPCIAVFVITLGKPDIKIPRPHPDRAFTFVTAKVTWSLGTRCIAAPAAAGTAGGNAGISTSTASTSATSTCPDVVISGTGKAKWRQSAPGSWGLYHLIPWTDLDTEARANAVDAVKAALPKLGPCSPNCSKPKDLVKVIISQPMHHSHVGRLKNGIFRKYRTTHAYSHVAWEVRRICS